MLAIHLNAFPIAGDSLEFTCSSGGNVGIYDGGEFKYSSRENNCLIIVNSHLYPLKNWLDKQ